ncbi:hypothetical protein RCL_jg3692.t1 [Rhizophagus clarus]|uniref:Uncharacterized protein n=1 Tax=Rhizophagus clarus TaxID=94130 RepID=A0A8H3M7I0_9GLOM|nr:hypothetical protein RCL_jg3692.t1 [Rhizophagus clarus]
MIENSDLDWQSWNRLNDIRTDRCVPTKRKTMEIIFQLLLLHTRSTTYTSTSNRFVGCDLLVQENGKMSTEHPPA